MVGNGLTEETLRQLRRAAARHSRATHEVEDLVQDVLLSAIEHGRDCADSRFLPWAFGAIRNRAAFAARTAARRRRREQAAPSTQTAEPVPRFSDAFIASLPPSRRIVALLVNLGMSRLEIAYLLDLNAVALRQRISGLRKAFEAQGGDAEVCDLGLTEADGMARRALKAALPQGKKRAFAIRDPDGVPIFFSRGGHVPEGDGN